MRQLKDPEERRRMKRLKEKCEQDERRRKQRIKGRERKQYLFY